ncbi:hypothetical protein BKA62DRAFT_778088 [Auriculariales sp. MPI-PUGE-AT-0066]|nr:hypothetical protein BKA62DRAFT_778088 [Auriculariales sp. MPI-PUGE-AT-0066]
MSNVDQSAIARRRSRLASFRTKLAAAAQPSHELTQQDLVPTPVQTHEAGSSANLDDPHAGRELDQRSENKPADAATVDQVAVQPSDERAPEDMVRIDRQACRGDYRLLEVMWEQKGTIPDRATDMWLAPRSTLLPILGDRTNRMVNNHANAVDTTAKPVDATANAASSRPFTGQKRTAIWPDKGKRRREESDDESAPELNERDDDEDDDEDYAPKLPSKVKQQRSASGPPKRRRLTPARTTATPSAEPSHAPLVTNQVPSETEDASQGAASGAKSSPGSRAGDWADHRPEVEAIQWVCNGSHAAFRFQRPEHTCCMDPGWLTAGSSQVGANGGTDDTTPATDDDAISRATVVAIEDAGASDSKEVGEEEESASNGEQAQTIPSTSATYGCLIHPNTTNLNKNECCVHEAHANISKRLEHGKKYCRFMKAGRQFLRKQLERYILSCPPCALAAYEGYCEPASAETMNGIRRGDVTKGRRQQEDYGGTRCPGCGVIITARTWCSFEDHAKTCDIIGLLEEHHVFEWWVHVQPRTQSLRPLQGKIFPPRLAAWRRTHQVQAS